MIFSEALRTVTYILYSLNIIFAVIIIFIERHNPAVTWAWLMLLAFFPFFGFVIYLLLGMQSRKYGIFVRKAKDDELIYNEFNALDYPGLSFVSDQKNFIEKKFFLHPKVPQYLSSMIYLNYKAGHGAFTSNNRLSFFYEGNTKFSALLDDIENAKHFIHIQYYIFRNDSFGRHVLQALVKKASEGVEVRMFVDGMGSMNARGGFLSPLRKAGGKTAVFLPPYFIRVNYRNHRKLCIIDGHIGYIGGLNIGNEYVGKSKIGFWRDTHIRVIGDAVKQMELRFIMDWNFVKKKDRIPLESRYFPPIRDHETGAGMQIVSSGPDTKWASVHQGYAKMIYEAEKSIYIQTPYFVPDDSIFKALRIAALSDIDVRIVIPAHPDHPFVYWASLSYLGELLPAGIKCYEYTKGFIHSKLIIVDSVISSVGTANMDVRSFDMNFETNAFIYDPEAAKEFENQFILDLDDCTEITQKLYDSRSHFTKIKESVSRLLSPLL